MIARLRTGLAVTAIVVATAGVAFWAGTRAVVPPSLPLASHFPVTYTVQRGTVSSSVRVSVTASWPVIRSVTAARDGVVTSVMLAPGQEAKAGTIVATVNLDPVVVGIGEVPMFRRLVEGAKGPDVRQLQQLITIAGFYRGVSTGKFDKATTAAVKRWQRSLGVRETGAIELGQLLFLPSVPVRVVVVPRVGDVISPGSDLVRIIAPKPEFKVALLASQRSEVAQGNRVSVSGPGHSTWEGTVSAINELPDGSYAAMLDGTLCGADCSAIDVSGQTRSSGSIELVPATSGPVVPTSAIAIMPSGEPVVTLPDGSKSPIKIVATANGLAVVDGIDVGTSIRLPAP